ncbi:Dymeclin [Blakeslea trispora]|nr:Dymeclin [Blakeslea trispora]
MNNTTHGEMLIEALLYIMMNMDPCFNHSTYEFYTEVLNTLIVLCSTQLHQSKLSQTNNYFLDILMSKFANRAETIVARLLENMIAQKTAPPQSSSVMYTAYNYFFSSRPLSTLDPDAIPVADRSLLLLLLFGTQPESDLNQAWMKAYRFALANLSDHHVISSDMDGQDRRMHLISFKDLFDIFSTSIEIEERMVLFYLILKENEPFRVFVLSRTDQETIYLPILKLIYESLETKANYAQLYMLFSILLILSEDDMNNEAMHKVAVNQIPWFTERPLLKSISLGGLIILVLIRALQLNLSHHKDIYLHTNALAILSNMSNTIFDMHAYVAQRLISFFEVLARRYSKSIEASTTDSSVYEDLLVLLLETINATLTYRLKHNAQLVYALLQKREIFIPFASHPRFVNLVHNLEQVIHHFNTRVSEANLKAPSSSEVLQLIEQASRTWSNQQWIVLPQLKFQFKEDPNSFEFFIPYIWALIYRKSFFYWSDEKCHALENHHRLNEEVEF